MRMKTNERWHCTNPGCGCEVLVESGATAAGDGAGNESAGSTRVAEGVCRDKIGAMSAERNPMCACGGAMKKRYVPPRVGYLEFLRVDDSLAATSRARQG